MHFGQNFKWSKDPLLTNVLCISEMSYLSYGRYRSNDGPDDFSFIRYIFFLPISTHKCARRDLWASALTAPDTLFLYRVGKRFTVQRLAHCRVKERVLSIYYASMKCGSVDENLSEATWWNLNENESSKA